MADMNGMVVFQRGQDATDSDVWDDTALIKAYNSAINEIKGQVVEENAESEQSQPSEFKKPLPQKKKKPKKQKKNKNKLKQWRAGDECLAIYTEDGLIYEACIISMNYSEGTCIVRYTDYGNEEEQNLTDLLLPTHRPSNSDTKMESSECESNYTSPHSYSQHKKNSSSKRSKSSKRQRQFDPTNPPWIPPYPFPPNNFNGMPPSFPWNNMPPSSTGMPFIPPPPPPTNNEAMNSNEALCSMLMSWYMSGYHTGYYQGLTHSQKKQF